MLFLRSRSAYTAESHLLTLQDLLAIGEELFEAERSRLAEFWASGATPAPVPDLAICEVCQLMGYGTLRKLSHHCQAASRLDCVDQKRLGGAHAA